jgi:hypothetical protein
MMMASKKNNNKSQTPPKYENKTCKKQYDAIAMVLIPRPRQAKKMQQED